MIDGRSAGHSRTTGWERYTRELVTRLTGKPGVTVHGDHVGSPVRRLLDDQLLIPAAARKYGIAHYPSFPPTHFPSGTDVLYTLYDLTWWRYPETASTLGRHYYRPLAERAVKRSTVLTISETVADEIRDHFNLPREQVVATALGSSLPTDVEPTARARPYFLSVASVEPRKNLASLVTAFEKSGVAATHDLVFVGRQAWGDLPRGVELVTGLDDRALASMYAGATATVNVSLYEGFGLPLLESLTVGTPVLCSDLPVFHEVAGDFATYVDPLNTDDVASALQVATNQQRVPESAMLGFRAHTWDHTVDKIVDVYKSRGFGAPVTE